jgi:lipopolysaccharide transport system ATP-binding protein
MGVMVTAEGLGKRYRLGESTAGYGRLTDSLSNLLRRRRGEEARSDGEVWALRNASFEIEQGEVVGLIGRNGAGKSTLLKLLARVTTPTEGRAQINGRVGSLLEVGTGFHQELTGRENVYLSGAILGMRRSEIQRKFDEIVDFADVEGFIDTPVKRYSSGMGLRLGFAVAAFLEPEVLLVDEVLAVGDLRFREKCLGRIGEVSREDGRTVFFVSHDLNAIRSTCRRAFLIDKGELSLTGRAADVVAAYESRMADAAVTEGVYHRQPAGPASPEHLFRSVRLQGGEACEGSGRVAHGQPLTLVIETDPAAVLQRFGVAVRILDRRHRPVAYMSSAEMKGTFFAPGDVIECSIPFVPLVAGAYAVELSASIPGVQGFDLWAGDIWFEVNRFDPFQTGSTFTPSEESGPFVPAHEWSARTVDDGLAAGD